MSDPDLIARTASRHRLSESGIRALSEALAAGRGGGAQWSHPDLGGMGQWSRGGMIQIGDMVNHDLKARVAAAIEELARAEPGDDPSARPAPSPGSDWWGEDLGRPASTGAQNGMRYACFPERRRLAVDRDGRVTLYDTGAHRLTGFAQAQSGSPTLSFSGPDGPIDVGDLRVLSRS